jgi:aryl-alcohol dehydrogenase-like predicted oxidoreductase
MKRVLGRSGIQVSAVGMGCWAIGGPWTMTGDQAGWSSVDDDESIRAIHAAMDLGANFFDTAANYGAGHSERILGKALAGRRDRAVIATKFGYEVDEKARTVVNYDGIEVDGDIAPHVRADVERSLARLGTDYVDVLLLHVWALSIERALEAGAVVDELVREGKVRTYGWSTDRADAIEAFSAPPAASVAEIQFNVLTGNPELPALCERLNLGAIIRAPLGMGVLTGKFTPQTTFATDDVRAVAQWFPGIQNGKPTQEWIDALASVRDVLTSSGRTLAQGSLAWLWGRSPAMVPIPGFRTVAQAQENARAMEFGALTPAQMTEIDRILGR